MLDFGIVSGLAGLSLVAAYPLAGFLSDRTLSRFGRRRPWILGGTLLFAGALVGLAFADGLVQLGVLWSIALVGFSAASAALAALIADAVPAEQRGLIAGWVSMPRAIGIIVGVFLFSTFLGSVSTGYIVLAVAVAVVVFVIPILMQPEVPLPPEERPDGGLIDYLEGLWVSPKRAPDFTWSWVSGALVNGGHALGTALLLYFVAFELGFGLDGSPQGFLPLVGAYLASVLISAPLIGWMSDRLGMRKIFVIWCAALQAVAAFIVAFFPTYSASLITATLLGIGYGGYLAVGQALATHVLPDPRSRAKDLGIMNVAYQVPIAVAPLVAALIVAGTGGFAELFLISALLIGLGAAAIGLVSRAH